MANGPVCIITGASGGIASGIARKLSADGYRLMLMSRGGCGDLAQELGQAGFSGSVLEDGDVEDAVAETVSRLGGLMLRSSAVAGRGIFSRRSMCRQDRPQAGTAFHLMRNTSASRLIFRSRPGTRITR
jgi:NAD(P)-dependent dehydrogenase (short-subunit alcohol dehydrogenase family)